MTKDFWLNELRLLKRQLIHKLILISLFGILNILLIIYGIKFDRPFLIIVGSVVSTIILINLPEIIIKFRRLHLTEKVVKSLTE